MDKPIHSPPERLKDAVRTVMQSCRRSDVVYYKVLYEKLQVLRTEHMVNTNWHSQRISAATAAVDVHVLKWLALVCKATVRTVMGKVVRMSSLHLGRSGVYVHLRCIIR